MFKNIVIFVLILTCAIQGYILYANKERDWLNQTVKQIQIDIKKVIKPSDSIKQPTASPTSSSTIINKEATITPAKTTTTSQTTSFAFDHLTNNANCESTDNLIVQTICSDADLSDQDKRLNFILKKWSNSNKLSEFPISEQAQWIKLRSESCSNITKASLKSCIQSLTEARIQAITGQI